MMPYNANIYDLKTAFQAVPNEKLIFRKKFSNKNEKDRHFKIYI